MTPTSLRLAHAGVIAMLSLACNVDVTTAPTKSLRPGLQVTALGGVALPPVLPGDSASADTLARGFALALADPALRQLLVADLRDSPFARHALDLTTYLRAPHAGRLLAAIARALGVRREEVLDMTTLRGGLELVLPIVTDRLDWAGSGDIAVLGSAYTVSEDVRAHHQPFAYTVRGQVVPAYLTRSLAVPLLRLDPTSYFFGLDPEGTRAQAPRHSRVSVSTPTDERHENFVLSKGGMQRFDVVACNNNTAIMPDTPCSADPSAGEVGVYLPSLFTFTSCVPNGGSPISDESQDHDRDGVSDACEYELAQAFHPQMQFMSSDCNATREPYWAANYEISPINGQPVIDIFYAIGYHYDCGEPECGLPWWCSAHYGDSEFIVLEVSTDQYPTYNGGHWLLRYATLSAHYATQFESTGTYAGGDLEYAIAAPYSNPVSWVSDGKHGNYRSRAVCFSGANYFDNCAYPGVRVGLEVLPGANLGSYEHQSNAFVQSRTGHPEYPGIEHLWSLTTNNGDGFLGWFPRSYGSGERPYGSLLRNYGF